MAGPSDICKTRLQAFFKEKGAKVTQKAIDEIVDELSDKKSKLYADDPTTSDEAFKKAVQDKLTDMRLDRAQAMREKSENILKRQKLYNLIKQDAYKDDPVRAFKAILLGGEVAFTDSGSYRPAANGRWMADKALRNMENKFKEAGLDTVLKDGALDRKVMQELAELKPDGSPGISGDKNAQTAANIIKGVQRTMLKNLQTAGARITELQGYISKQIHSYDLVSKVSQEDWVNYVMPRLDGDKTFGNMPPDERVNMLSGIYKDIVTKKWGSEPIKDVSDEFLTIVGRGSPNIGEKASRSRGLHFKDADSFYDYSQKFSGKNLLENTISQVNRASIDAEIMRNFGTNPQGTIDGLRERISREYKAMSPEERPITDAALDHITDKNGSFNRITMAANYLLGNNRVAGMNPLAENMAIARQAESWAKTGGALVSSLDDFMSAGTVMKEISGRSRIATALPLITEYFKNFVSPERAAEIASDAGVALDHFQGALLAKYGGPDSQPGIRARMNNGWGRINLIENHDNAAKGAMAKLINIEMAKHADTPFENLDKGLQSFLGRYGIDANHWSMLTHSVYLDDSGKNIVNPSAISKVPDELFKGGAKDKFDFESKYVAMLNDSATQSAMRPNERNQYLLGPDKSFGIALRLLGQFKSTAFQMMDNIKRAFLGNAETKPQGYADLASKFQATDAYRNVGFIVGSMALGMGSKALKDIASGKVPSMPKDWRDYAEIIAHTVAGPMMADMVFSSGSASQTAANLTFCPVVGEGLKAVDIAKHLGKAQFGDEDKHDKRMTGVKMETASFIRRNAPGNNLFYAKWAYDKVLNAVLDDISPGHSEKVQSTAERKGQKYLPGLSPTGK